MWTDEPETIATELARWNALTPDEAGAILAKAEGQRPDFRSCWWCNGAHEHLKSREVLLCFACGYYFLSGYPAQAVVLRSKGEHTSPEQAHGFFKAIDEA